jgi:hypothetical protein
VEHSLLIIFDASDFELLQSGSVPINITLHYITLHYITLHYITLHYITLHYITHTTRSNNPNQELPRGSSIAGLES